MQNATTSDLLRSAISAHQEGDYIQAEDLYRQVISLSPDNVEALHHLALIYIADDQPEVAIPLLEDAISISHNNPELVYNLALAYQKNQDNVSAVYYYKRAIELKPDFSLAYNNLGVAYQHLGELNLANQSLKNAFTIDPYCADAHYNFAQSHKFTVKDAEYIQKLKYLLTENKWNNNKTIKLNFTLGKIHDDLAEYATAFHYYQTANTLKNQGFNIEQYKRYIDQLIFNYTPSLINKLKSSVSSSKNRFIFVIGMPRSGTTLVEQIIASHPAVQCAGEIGFIGEIVDEIPTLLHSPDPYPNCVRTLKPEHLIKISTTIHAQVEKFQQSSNIITDKSPVNFLHLGLILLLFPDSVIIHCNRDPIDIGLSCFFQNFDKQHQYSYDLKTLALFYNEYARLMRHWKSLFPGKIYDICYEALVNQQITECKKLIAACDLNWNDKCLAFYNSKSVVSTASKWQIRRPIYKTSINKWKNYEAYIGELINNLKMPA